MLHGTKGGSLSVSSLRAEPAFYPVTMPSVTPGEIYAFFDDVECASGIGADDRLLLTDSRM